MEHNPADRDKIASAPISHPRNGGVATALVMVVAFMVGLSFAAVPLYGMFCAVTGYSGTPQRVSAASGYATSEYVNVRFDASVSPGLKWSFEPVIRETPLRVGENKLIFYRVTNLSTETLTGTATYNVTPDQMGAYFMKVQCFCFQEQTLKPGETVEMPVSFFIDPSLVADRDLSDLREVTLSYTFFRVQKPTETVLKSGKSTRDAI